MNQQIPTPTQILADLIRQHGPIGTVRVSSAQARGRAKKYSYWGAARYELRLTKKREVANLPLEAAGSDRRADWLAYRDAKEIADSENRLMVQTIGRIGDDEAAEILSRLAGEANVA